ncbi:CDP-glycerol glycerophosphotransferase family protein [Bacillus sp. S3]|uniref:CDP-glycerol glycerophosphotransferase family protein n=1 Tax=Bacillus sp. S3 TaxID=486398 RepID=UPI0016813FF7|nr:CDP-glycerol glycerophosphotransferase family protein [Bacillus sp. S3]
MSHYLANYWNIYREFLETFKNFKFNNIPIAIVTNFYQHFDSELKRKMEAEDFTNESRYELKKEMIQPYFDKWLGDTRLTHTDGVKGGKVLINYDYTRIPESCYKTLFDPKQTIILSRSAKTHLYGIPVETLHKYEQSNDLISIQLVKNAETIFKKLHDHPVFSNEFFQQTFLKRIPLIVKTISTVCHFFEHVNISAIVVGTTEDVVSRVLAIVGTIHGIKSVCLQHGALMGEEAFMPVFTTTVAVYGEYEKNWYLQRGVPQERIAEIGHPKYDEIFTKTRGKKKSFYKRFNLDPAKQTLLVITGPNIEPEKFLRLMRNILANTSYQIIIKPHPWEVGKGKCGIYFELEKKYKTVQVFTSRENYLYDLISQVDGVVASLSTVVLESILFSKPVFIFDFVISNRSYDYYEKLGEFLQTGPDRLTEVIDQFFSTNEKKEDYQRIRSEYASCSYNDGTSGKKLLAHLNELQA